MSIACLSSTGFAFDLECQLTFDQNWDVIGIAYTCITTNMNIKQRNELMASADSVPTLDRVTAFMSQGATVHYMPKFHESLAQQLVVLKILQSHMKTIEQRDFKQFSNLRFLSLRENDLQWLESDLFEFVPKLEVIGFAGNKLKFIGANILQSLENLKSVDFQNVGCDDNFGSKAETSDSLEVLKTKLLTQCKPKDILTLMNDNDELRQKIYELEKSAKQQSSVRKNVNQECSLKLQSCNENFDVVTKLLTPLVDHVDSMLNEQRIVDVICDKFSDEMKVCVAMNFAFTDPISVLGFVKDDSGNFVDSTILIIRQQFVLFLPTNLRNTFLGLEMLEVSNCGLFYIDRKAFRGLDSLISLNLTRNKISSIAKDSFTELKNLAVLDLSFNNIKLLTSNILSSRNAIKLFKINNNRLSEIDSKIVEVLSECDEVDFTENFCIDDKYQKTDIESENESRATVIDNNCKIIQ